MPTQPNAKTTDPVALNGLTVCRSRDAEAPHICLDSHAAPSSIASVQEPDRAAEGPPASTCYQMKLRCGFAGRDWMASKSRHTIQGLREHEPVAPERFEVCTGTQQVTPMLRSLKELEQYKVSASDGDVGTVVNFLFDDERWAIRHLVVKTGGFFNERDVLISPISFRQVDWATQTFHLALTKDKIKKAPNLDTHRPVSRQHEQEYYRYYGYPYYWGYMGGYMGAWGPGYYPTLLASGSGRSAVSDQADQDPGDAHLRSAKEVRGYHIQGSDDAIGFVEDFIVDDETWEVRYLVVDTSHWWWGHRVLVAHRWTSQVSWTQRKVFLSLSREAIKNSPSWDSNSVVRREYETRLHDYYGLQGYWGEGTNEAGHATTQGPSGGEAALPNVTFPGKI